MKNLFFIIGLTTIFVSCSQDNKIINSDPNLNLESCISCHSEVKGFTSYHNPQKIGCSSCHKGNILSFDKDLAHKNIIKIPGNLSNAANTCGTTECHKTEYNRLRKSLMTTNSGLVSIDKLAFGEIHSSDTLFHIQNIKNSAADKHIKNLCYKCHLGYEKKHYAPISQLTRGGGCLACHLNYNKSQKPDINDNYHPALNLYIDNSKCFGCHSRSARISTNFEGWYETLKTKDEVKNKIAYRVLDDNRIFAKNTEDVHHKAEMACIDCHLSQEIMGDGQSYKHENQAIKIQCIDCHPKNKFKSIKLNEFDKISILDYALRNYSNSNNTFIATKMENLPLVNTIIIDSINAYLTGKLNKKKYVLKNIRKKCGQDKVHNNLTCSMCHSAWAPRCIGCHTDYDPDKKLKGGHKGKWFELVDDFGASMPTMGMKKNNDGYKIKPTIPGMIMTLNKNHFKGKKYGKDIVFKRWFAPVSPHTIVKKSRSCTSCHLNTYTLGFGSGKIELIKKDNKAYWSFQPEYENNKNDNLPEDAWIGFLKDIDDSKIYSAHNNFYPLNLELQKKILKVGSCLQCHNTDNFKQKMLSGTYLDMLKHRSKYCLIPD